MQCFLLLILLIALALLCKTQCRYILIKIKEQNAPINENETPLMENRDILPNNNSSNTARKSGYRVWPYGPGWTGKKNIVMFLQNLMHLY